MMPTITAMAQGGGPEPSGVEGVVSLPVIDRGGVRSAIQWHSQSQLRSPARNFR